MRDFIDFRFGNYYSKDLHLLAVSSGGRYNKNLLPTPTDYTDDVPGGDGQYYFGQVFKNREFTIEVAFDSVSEENFRLIAQLFACDKLQDLVFDEEPYKVYRAKLRSAPDFKHICFTDRHSGKRVYKGEGTLNFICYYPYAYCFNRYVVRAADYYQCLQPEEIITNSIEDNPYKIKKKPKLLPGRIKNHYNVEPNLNTPWKGGYPAKEQVWAGELYFNDPIDKERKKIIDVRRYWENIPEWECAAKLLTTPTLDYDRELIYLPQYSKTNYYDMDTGLFQQSHLFGSRLLVYNPGDIPIDFELKLGNLRSDFRGNTDDYLFRIQRFNVQRLTIEQAVDWTGLDCFEEKYNQDYKYGNRYFAINNSNDDNSLMEMNMDFSGFDLNGDGIIGSDDGQLILKLIALNGAGAGSLPDNIPIEELFKIGKDITGKDKKIKETLESKDINYYYTSDIIKENFFDNLYPNRIEDIIKYSGENIGYYLESSDLFYEEGSTEKVPKTFYLPFYTTSGEYKQDDLEGNNKVFRNKIRKALQILYFIFDTYNFDTSQPTSLFTYISENFNKDNPKAYMEIEEFKNKVMSQYKYFTLTPEMLKNSHPRHCYIVEPIPREKLGYFIRLFYWQSSHFEDYMASNVVNYQEGLRYADRYEELYNLCNSEEEQYELYWKTLKEAILDRYKEADEYIKNCVDHDAGFFNDDYTFEDFCYDYIYKPPEYIRQKIDLKYGQFIFNLCRLPEYYTFDFLDINAKNFDKIPFNNCGCDNCTCHEDLLRPQIKPLILDTEKESLYCDIKPEWRDQRLWSGKMWQENNPDKLDNFYNFKPKKLYFNDNIVRGHWFKIPPGWSIIDISPVSDEDRWGGKRWLDARPFKWGTTDEEFRKAFNKVYYEAAVHYLARHIPRHYVEEVANKKRNSGYPYELPPDWTIEELEKFFYSFRLEDLEEYLMFRRWYKNEYILSYEGYISDAYLREIRPPGPDWGEPIVPLKKDEGEFYEDQKWKDSLLGLGYEMQIRKVELAEYGFLKTLADYWHSYRKNDNCSCVGDLDEWWWYANDYIWDNLPPLYWGYADLLNKAEINYVPLFY